MIDYDFMGGGRSFPNDSFADLSTLFRYEITISVRNDPFFYGICSSSSDENTGSDVSINTIERSI